MAYGAAPRMLDSMALCNEPISMQADGPTIALIPAYNESRFIGSVVLSVRRYVDIVVVVDDGSSDNTADLAQRAGATVIRHQRNQGKAAAINTGFGYLRSLRPSAAVMLDGDGQHYPEDIPTVIEPVLRGTADLVIGSRFLKIANDIPAYRQVGQHSLTIATNLASGLRVSDSQSGFRALSARALELLCFSQAGFSIESEMQFLAQEHGLQVTEAPIKVIYAEPVKRNPILHGMQVLGGIVQLIGQSRPLLYFSAAGLLMLTPGSLLGLYIVDIFIRTQKLATGYALITVMLCLIGMLLFFSGIILHSTRCMLSDLRQSLLSRTAAGQSDAIISVPTSEPLFATQIEEPAAQPAPVPLWNSWASKRYQEGELR